MWQDMPGIAEYLQIPFVPGAGELAPLAAMVVAAGLGFLWYNFLSAQIIMGDVGSLGMGSFLGAMAVLTKNELLLVIIGGIIYFRGFVCHYTGYMF